MRIEISPKKYKNQTIQEILREHEISQDFLETLIWQGSVWHNKRRIRDLNYIPSKENPEHLISVWKTQYPIYEFHLNPNLIKYEDEAILIVYKPPGVNTSESVYSDLDCLTYGIQKHLGNMELNTIHRLDRDTQGLVIYGKNKEIEKYLYGLFMNRQIKKRYVFATEKDVQSHKKAIQAMQSFEYKGKTESALTNMYFLYEKDNLRLYLAIPKTGRTHQIRKHALMNLSPIFGDPVYGQKEDNFLLSLACIGYKFIHPITHESFSFTFLPQIEYFKTKYWQ